MAVAYYNDPSFRSNQVALDLAIKNFFSEKLFDGDQTRVLYASNQYCYRGRAEQLRLLAGSSGRAVPNGLNFPFLNYWQMQEAGEVSHVWKSASMLRSGIWVDELGTKLQVAPVTHSYQVVAHYATMADADYAFSTMSWDTAFPFEIPLTLTWKKVDEPLVDVDVPLPVLMTITPEFNPEFNEAEWLNKGDITTVVLDFKVETFRLRAVDPNAGAFWVPTSAVFNFTSKSGLDVTDYAQALTLAIDHTTETVTET